MKKNHKSLGRTLIFCTFYIITTFCYSNANYNNCNLSLQDSIKIIIQGKITDQFKNPIHNVHIGISGRKSGTMSNQEGIYSIKAFYNDTLRVSYLGYKTQLIAINNRKKINIQLIEDITELDAITLNAGYYKVSEKVTTGSIVKVSKEHIEFQPVSNPLSALQGRVTGVEIVQSSGVPGSEFSIKIRGQNSIRQTGNSPLYIVNGVPYSSNSLGDVQTSGSILPGGKGSNPLNNINTSDIERIEILKDADATAIYGSRGANGVVLITTKSGTAGKTTYNFNITTGFGHVSNRLPLLSTPQYIAMRQEAYRNDGVTEIPSNAYDINGTWSQSRDTNWQKEFFGKTAIFSSVQSSIRGGTERTKFMISNNLNRQTTVFPGEFENIKFSLLSTLQHRTKDDRLSLNFSMNYTKDNNNLLSTDLVREALYLPPNAPELYNEDGTLNWANSTWNNPLRQLESEYSASGNSLIGNLTIDYKLLENLKIIGNLGYTESSLAELRTIPSTTLNPAYGLGSEASSAIHNAGSRKSWIIEPQLHWNFNLNDVKIATLFGLTFQDQRSERLGQYASGFSSNALIENIAAASNLYILGNTESNYKYNAFFSRLNMNKNGKYIINLTGRRDGSSRFGEEKRFSNFGAIGAAWILSEEKLFKRHLPFLSFGKIRASYGVTGNDQIGDYQYLDTYTVGSSQYDGVTGIHPTRLYNPNYNWEKNKKIEIALDLGLYNDRIFFSTNFYTNKSSNQLIGIPLPGTTGFNIVTANLDAIIENKGWEFAINTTNISNSKFKWSSSINLSIAKNELLEFPELEGSSYANELVIGESLNIVKVYDFNGVDQESGLYTFTDVNSDGAITPVEDKQTIVNLDPKYYGGFSNHITWKKFSLDALFQFTKQLGYDFYASSGVPGSQRNQTTAVLSRWQNPGDETSLQKYTSGLNSDAFEAYTNYSESDAVLTDASYIRLKTVSLNYNLPISGTLDGKCQLFIQGQNLLTLTKYNGLDPETRSSSVLPPLKVISIGTKITF
ncbi:SusC/RagA family TonB-linked outer membrane protein [Cellulophaga omnivescoria]|uniref:SusC/RagA family TonB-linked outer membrane protein n=1 Tax=Cellulophaga omnivescoria TaxID=1888890 RepID=UPI0009876830|nr:SusC/RagA family TonB-linked outer membrane protein [Cellulophaga omnivescoria]